MKVRLSLLVVLIASIFTLLKVHPFKDPNEVYMGTAWFLNDQGYVVTAYHVVKGEKNFVISVNGKLTKAFIFAIDSDHDVVILKVLLDNTPYLPVSPTIISGESINTYGYPIPEVLGDNLKKSSGSVYNPLIGSDYRSTAKTCPGNSGGPVVAKEGVIGIVNYGMPFFDQYNCSVHSYGTTSKYIIELAAKNNIAIYTSKLGFNYDNINASQVFEIYSY